ncbi:ribulose-phosphate 3-epimerase [Brooklawnia cerclae]|uniref:Ribulose-phosphate 3-epimerase n=1 Tax=Brooklawnia cerclae TaxID=349934 RepID=A0ABX0SNB3_9ACTN|nr:ribulose-phosphate 3-epimerase [Brooklawnia cerclae]NIH58251.1 ribulose-phosphate 3-epimerase [Brooklawnia cerclae]
MLNAPSIANSPLLRLGDDLAAHVANGITLVHIDIMDGHYVPNLCFPLSIVSEIKQTYPDLVTDAHLMVTDVDPYIERLAEAGCDAVSFPSDATRFARRTITAIQAHGMRAGVVLNPSQRVDVLEPYLSLADYVNFMAVEPGISGQKMLPGSFERMAELVALREKTGSTALIEVDGGVTHEVALHSLQLGFEVTITGIYATYDPELGLAKATEVFEQAMGAHGFVHDPDALARLRRQPA